MQSRTPTETDGQTQVLPESDGSAISLEQLWRVLTRRRWIIILFIGVCVGGTLAYVQLTKRMYSSSATLDINQQDSQSTFSDLLKAPGADEASTRMQTEEKIMASSTVLLQMANQLDLIHKPEFAWLNAKVPDVAHLDALQKADLAASLRHDLTFSIVPGTTIVSVTYVTPNPILARDVPNAVLDAYIGADLGSGQIGTKQVSEWLQRQTNDLRHQVEASAQKLADFQRIHNLVGADESQNVQVDKLRMLNEQVGAAQLDRIGKETNYRLAQTGNVELLGTLGLDPQLTALRSQQSQLQAEYNALNTRYGQGYPRMHELTLQLQAAEAQITAEVDALRTHYQQDFTVAKQNEDRLTAEQKEAERSIFNLDERAAEYAMLRHDAESTRTLYDEIQLKVKESGIIDTLKSTRFRMVDEAPLPNIPVSPRKTFDVLVSLVLGLLGGCILAFIVDAVDDAVFSAAELERQTALPVVGITPHIDFPPSQKSQLISLNDARSPGSEAFRSLRTAMLLGFGDGAAKVQVITSTTQGEGKSVISTNYARVLAQGGARVLLIDADLRRGSIHLKMGQKSLVGLTNLLSDRSLLADFTPPDPELPTLSVLPRGPIPPNPTELLGSKRFLDLVESWRAEFDYVILDSAPILPVSDTLTIAQHADLVFLVVRVGITSTTQLLRVRERLRRLNVPVKGLILNDVTKAFNEYNYYYSGYEYGDGNEKG